MNTELKNQFHDAMLSIYWLCGRATKYWPNYYLRSVRNHGGLIAAQNLLHRPKQQGLDKLHKLKRFDLTVEALIWDNPKYHELFTRSEMQEVKNRLIEFGYLK